MRLSLIILIIFCFQVTDGETSTSDDEKRSHHSHRHHHSHVLSGIVHGHHNKHQSHHEFHSIVHNILQHMSNSHIDSITNGNSVNDPVRSTEQPHATEKDKYLPFKEWLTEWTGKENNCGKPEIEHTKEKKIKGGHTVVPGSCPWMASLTFEDIGQHFCGGVLIYNQWVLTAAHCFIPQYPGMNNDVKQNWTVRLGVHDAYPSLQPRQHEERFNISKLILHPQTTVRFDADLALIKLDNPVSRNKWISPICLPQNTKYSEATGRECTILGYGLSDDSKKPLVLREAEVPFYDRKECVEEYAKDITDNMICAGYESGGVDSCSGDSGGPLQCFDEDTWRMYGIISHGRVNCAQPKKPGLYTKVINYLTWIHEQIYQDYVASFDG